MHPVHTGVHHELHRQRSCRSRFEYHRTDGRSGRSAPLQYFNVGSFTEAQGLVTHIHNLELDFNRLT